MAVTLEELVMSLKVTGEAAVDRALTRAADKFAAVAVDAKVLTDAIVDLGASFDLLSGASGGSLALKFTVPPAVLTRLAAIVPLLDKVATAAVAATSAVAALNAQLGLLKGFSAKINVSGTIRTPGSGGGAGGTGGASMGPNQRLAFLQSQLAAANPTVGPPAPPNAIKDLLFKINAVQRQLFGPIGLPPKPPVVPVAPPFPVGPYQTMIKLQQELTRATLAGNDAAVKDIRLKIAQTEATIAQATGAQSLMGRVAAGVQNFLSRFMMVGFAIGFVAMAVENLLKRVEERGKEIADIRQIAGSTPQQAARFDIISRIAGVNPAQMTRELGRLARAGRTPQTDRALGQLGIKGQLDGNVLDIFDKVQAALSKMPDGARKTSIEIGALGQKAMVSLQSVLRLTDAQRAMAKTLSDNFNPKTLEAVQSFQVSIAMLGETLMTYLVQPFVVHVLPALASFVDEISQVVAWISKVATFKNVWFDIAIGIGLVATAVKIWEAAVVILNARLAVTAALGAFISGLVGNWKGIALGATAAIATGFGIKAISNYFSHDSANKETAKNTAASAKALDDIRGHIIGGGDRSRRAGTAAEFEAMRQMALG